MRPLFPRISSRRRILLYCGCGSQKASRNRCDGRHTKVEFMLLNALRHAMGEVEMFNNIFLEMKVCHIFRPVPMKPPPFFFILHILVPSLLILFIFISFFVFTIFIHYLVLPCSDLLSLSLSFVAVSLLVFW